MFSFLRKKKPTPEPLASAAPQPVADVDPSTSRGDGATGPEAAQAVEPARAGWLGRLRQGLAKTGAGITQVFTGTRIDDALFEELEAALLMADAGVPATAHLLQDLKRRVRDTKATAPAQVRELLVEAVTDLLLPLERGLAVGRFQPTVIMVVGVNGAGKTTTIGKLTRHLAQAGCKVLLAAADTFRAAAREQLAAWATRSNQRPDAARASSAEQSAGAALGPLVEIVSQEGGDPAAVTFDAVVAGRARGCDVVIADTAGRLPTQVHLMEELKKIRRVIAKADSGAPHEVVLVVDGNTGQNALAQVKAFDEALGLTGLVVTKLDGTAKGGVLAAIALWSAQRAAELSDHRTIPVYFIGVGEQLEDLQTFSAREFAQALLS
jgi:fused signal recognition particle receptor